MKKEAAELIIFDLGRVLVDFDFKRVVRGLRRYTALNQKQIQDYFLRTPLWDAFEKGRLPPSEFFETLRDELGFRGLSFEKFAPLWNHIFTVKPDTVEILRQLRGRYRTAMLSNVNVMHWEHIRARHAFMSWFDYPVASYAVGYRKPEAEIFRIVLARAGVSPGRAIFIDDIASHVRAARSIGIRAYRFKNARQLKRDLAEVL